MDNRFFKVNGDRSEVLLGALELCFLQSGFLKAKSWGEVDKHTLYLSWIDCQSHKFNDFPCALSPSECLPMVEAWLENIPNTDMHKIDGVDDYLEDDILNRNTGGEVKRGFEVSFDRSVFNPMFTICQIRPVFTFTPDD